jgi:penicillin-binding protein 2
VNGERQVRARAIALAVFISAAFLVLASQLFFLQVIKGWEYKRQARAVTRRELPIPAQRGEIFDRNTTPLVVNQDSFAVDLMPAEVPAASRTQVLERLAQVLGLPPEEVHKRVPEKYYHLYQPIEIKGGVAFETIAYLAEHLSDFPGVTWHNKPIRNYLVPGSLAHLLGYVGDITREEIQILYNQGYAFAACWAKRSGKAIRPPAEGKDGKRFQMVDVREKYLAKARRGHPPEPGRNWC